MVGPRLGGGIYGHTHHPGPRRGSWNTTDTDLCAPRPPSGAALFGSAFQPPPRRGPTIAYASFGGSWGGAEKDLFSARLSNPSPFPMIQFNIIQIMGKSSRFSCRGIYSENSCSFWE